MENESTLCMLLSGCFDVNIKYSRILIKSWREEAGGLSWTFLLVDSHLGILHHCKKEAPTIKPIKGQKEGEILG